MPISDIKPALDAIAANGGKYKIFYDYYEGLHALNFASDKFINKFGRRLQTLRENLCKTVVTAPASRLEIINFLADQKNTENPAWALWKESKMPAHAGAVHREAFKTGDAYVLVWADGAGRARFYPQTAANITVFRSAETDEIERAAKAWRGSDGFYYLTLYYASAIEKYVTRGKTDSLPTDSNTFSERHVSGEEFPLKNPFGRVPVFHFRFDNDLQDFGNSLLRDVIPLNDALNKSWADILGAQEENMRRRRFVAGLQVETDGATGRKINPFRPDDDVWISGEETTRFGEFSDANLTEMIAVKHEAVKDIALTSGIPPSYFNLEQTGSAISGEALRRIEARFTSIIQDAQRSFGETWAEAMAFALSVQNKNTDLSVIETQWTDAAPVSMSEVLDNALKKLNLGWSIEQIQRDYGLSDVQIAKMSAELAAHNQIRADNAARFFNNGNQIIP